MVQDIIQRVRQRQVRSAFALTPQGLLVQEDDGQRKLVVPTSMQQKVMPSCHDEPTKGHTRVYRTTELVKQRYWWKGMGKDIENYMRSCLVCQVMKSNHRCRGKRGSSGIAVTPCGFLLRLQLGIVGRDN